VLFLLQQTTVIAGVINVDPIAGCKSVGLYVDGRSTITAPLRDDYRCLPPSPVQ
jgi:hypothetical protein